MSPRFPDLPEFNRIPLDSATPVNIRFGITKTNIIFVKVLIKSSFPANV